MDYNSRVFTIHRIHIFCESGVLDTFAIGKENLLGEVEYFRAMIKTPDLIDRVNEILLDYQLRYVRNCIELGAHIIWINGNWAMTEKPMVSREFTERFLAPPLRKPIEYAHSRGVPCIKHTDGNIWPIYDIIIDAGADGLHPIDPMAGGFQLVVILLYMRVLCYRFI